MRCMSGIPEATPIVLTEVERTELDGLARSTKTEYRLRQRACIVLLAAEGLATRAIARAVGCTTGTASKWRGGYAARPRAPRPACWAAGASYQQFNPAGQRPRPLLDRRPSP